MIIDAEFSGNYQCNKALSLINNYTN